MTFVRTYGAYEFIDVFLLDEGEHEQWFLTLANDMAIQFFAQSMLQNDEVFPRGKACLLKAFHSDTDSAVGESKLASQNGHLEMWDRTGIFTTQLESIKYATCPNCHEEALLMTDLAETEPVEEGGELRYYCVRCVLVVAA